MAVPSIAWTKPSPTAGWAGYNGYLELNFDTQDNKLLHYGVVATSSSIYSTNLFRYDVGTHTFTDLGGNSSLSNDCTDTSPTWPGNRHPVGQICYDSLRHGLWLSCGVCGGNNWVELWFFDLDTDTWTKKTPSTFPTPRDSAAMIYSPDDDVIFLFGSDVGPQTHDNWVYCPTTAVSGAQTAAGCTSGNNWTEVSVVGGVQPNGVSFPRMVYDTIHHTVLMYGGQTGGGTVQNETWSYDIPTKTWTQVALSTTAPTLYTGPGSPPTFALVFVPALGQVLYHQTYGTGAPRDWAYDPVADTWAVISSSGTSPSVDTVATFDPSTQTMVAYSKNAGSGDLEMWHGAVTWSQAVSFISSTIAHGVDGATTSAIDTTGASFLVLGVSDYTGGPGVTISDSKSNTWTALTAYTNTAGNMRVRIYYAWNPNVGSGHTFTSGGTGVYTAIAAAAFSGVEAGSDPYNADVVGLNDYATSNATPLQAGSISVAADDLAIAVEGTPFGQSPSLTWSINSGFTITDQYHASGVTEGVGLAYWINTGAGASVNPGWTPDNANASGAATIATFQAVAGGSPTLYLLVAN